MRFFTFLLLLLSLQATGQKKVLIQSIRISNNYEEVSVNPFLKPANERALTQALEAGLQKRFGDIAITYLGHKKILFMDKAIAKNPHTYMIDYQDLYQAKRNTNRKDFDILVDVSITINDFFKGKAENLQVVSKVKATDNRKHKLFKNKGTISFTIPPISFEIEQISKTDAKVYEGFPLNEEKIMTAYAGSLTAALAGQKTKPELTVNRHEFTEYTNFIKDATSYQVLARNDFAQWAFKIKILKFLTFTKYRPAIAKKQHTNQQILLGMRERRITDIGFDVGLPGLFEVSKMHKFFVLWSQGAPEQRHTYFLQANTAEQKALGVIGWSSDIQFKIKDEKYQDIGAFRYRLQGSSAERVLNYAHSLSRIYHPWSVLEGTLAGKAFNISTNPYALNAAEIKWDGKLVGLITHAAASKKYIRKRKNMLPYYIYFSPDVSAQDQELLLQTFQAFHLAQVLQNDRDLQTNQSTTASSR